MPSFDDEALDPNTYDELSTLADEALAQIIHDGPPPYRNEALTILVERYQRKLLRYASSYLWRKYNRSDGAEDVVQEAWKGFYQRMVNRGAPENVNALLHGITKFKIIDLMKHERRYIRLLDIIVFPTSLNVYENIHEKRDIIRRFLAEGHLTPYERKIWILRDFYDYPVKVIADILLRKPNTISVTLRNARKKWKRYIKGLPDAA